MDDTRETLNKHGPDKHGPWYMLRRFMDAASVRLIPPEVRHGDPDNLRRARLVIACAIALALLGVVYTVVLAGLGSLIAGLSVAVGTVVAVSAVCVMCHTGSTLVAGNLMAAALFGLLTAVAWRLGGHQSIPLSWYTVVPVVALSTAGRRSAFVWAAVVIVSLTTFHAVDYHGCTLPNDMTERQYDVLHLVALSGLILFVFALTYLYEVFKDRALTQLRRAEETLRSEKDLAENLIETAQVIVLLLDTEGRIVRFNRHMEEISGYRLEEVRGRDWFATFLPQGERDRRRALFLHAVGGSQARVSAGSIVTRQGQQREIEWHSQPLQDGRGEMVGMLATGEDVTERNQGDEELRESNAMMVDALEREKRTSMQLERAMDELEEAQQNLVEASRSAGMAEVATSVLHNVGNVLNSVNVSASIVADKVRQSEGPSLAKVVELLGAHADDLGTFLTEDGRGKHLPRFLAALADSLTSEQALMLEELQSLTDRIEHIKVIVSTQQSYAGAFGLAESISLAELLEDALKINASSLQRHSIEVVRDYADLPPVEIDKQKLLQILINLIRNAKHALDEQGGAGRRLTLRIAAAENDRARIVVSDNGVGIPAENMTQIFAHGFTTKQDSGGHGFGLHHGALLAAEMGGSLTAHSDGPGEGATFTLELPLTSAGASAATSGSQSLGAGS